MNLNCIFPIVAAPHPVATPWDRGVKALEVTMGELYIYVITLNNNNLYPSVLRGGKIGGRDHTDRYNAEKTTKYLAIITFSDSQPSKNN